MIRQVKEIVDNFSEDINIASKIFSTINTKYKNINVKKLNTYISLLHDLTLLFTVVSDVVNNYKKEIFEADEIDIEKESEEISRKIMGIVAYPIKTYYDTFKENDIEAEHFLKACIVAIKSTVEATILAVRHFKDTGRWNIYRSNLECSKDTIMKTIFGCDTEEFENLSDIHISAINMIGEILDYIIGNEDNDLLKPYRREVEIKEIEDKKEMI